MKLIYLKAILLCGFFIRKIESRISIPIYCEAAVAIPAPAIPISKVKIRSGSRIILRIPPVAMPIIASFAIPSKRRILFITNEVVIAGAAIKI